MARTARRLIALASACSVLGLAGFGLMDPPTDSHGKNPVKAAATKAAAKEKAPPEKADAKPAAAPKAAPKGEKHDDAHGEPDADPHDAHAPAAPHADAHEPEAPAAKPAAPAAQAEPETDESPTPQEALAKLRAGNERWVNNQVKAPHTDTARREEAARSGQKPFATILTCADSRIPTERVFDCGVADTFVVRVAGNVISPEVAGTIEYGAEHLHVPLLVVMGHTKCGAVGAAASGAEVGGNIGSLIEKITPAVARAKQQNPGAGEAEIASAAIRENVWQGIFDLLRTSSEARQLVNSGKLEIVGAVYDIGTGKIEWIGTHPWQDALVDAFEKRGSTPRAETADAGDGPHGH